ncbi:MAG: M20/M25/M40 family metallo-hydrolase [Pseudomonadota bacterium]
MPQKSSLKVFNPVALVFSVMLSMLSTETAISSSKTVIDPELIQTAVETLASADKAGRAPGSSGSRRAAQWLAEQLDRLGIGLVRGERLQEFGPLKNVVGMIPGTSDETIVIGAHYDHLGVEADDVYFGADDNASGCAAVLAIAEALVSAQYAPKRNIVFAFFDGEEKGKLGSLHYLSIVDTPYMIKRYHPPVLMLNFDMVGRMRDQRLFVLGVSTAPYWRDVLEANNSAKLNLSQSALSGFNSDHLAFLAYGSPVLHFFTGYHNDYHRPSDTVEQINFDGLRDVAELGLRIVTDVDRRETSLRRHVNDSRPFSRLAAEKLDLTHRLEDNRK